MVNNGGIIGEWVKQSREEGRAEGLAEAREERREEGRTQEARRLLRLVIGRRFGNVPADLDARIACGSAAWCETLLMNAAEVEALNELVVPEA